MNYYRKYRPQTVSELDLQGVRESFERILQSGKVAHAYLFSGPKGTGKTSAARILAKILHCVRNPQVNANLSLAEPCNKCEACRAIINGSHLGVVEMDAASNRGIDEIRNLREQIGLAPAQGNFTVYVIDEVHMLTTEAFNALLKTLEEPPKHAVFILATTEKYKVPETIVSRCHEVVFTKASGVEVIHSLNKAVTGEGLEIDSKSLDAIVKRADGSFRDAMKLLEQVSESGKKVDVQAAEKLLGSGSDLSPDSLIAKLMLNDKIGAMVEVERILDSGADVQLYATRLVETLRAKLISGVVSGKNKDLKQLILLTQAMTKAAIAMRQSPVPQLPLEIAVAEWEAEVKIDEENKIPEISVKLEVSDQEDEISNIKKPVKPGRQVTMEEVLEKWPEILKAVKPLNHSLEALLKSAKPVKVTNDWVTLEVFYAFHKEQLEQERYRRMLEEKTSEVLEAKVHLKYVLGKKTAQAVSMAPESVVNVTGTVADEDLVKAAEEIFG